jgi:hypothetical protein
LKQARKYLAEGSFRLAAEQLAGPVPTALKRPWEQLRGEASLLADLLVEPLEDVVRHAARTAEQREWLADFPRRYQGKAVLFDMVVERLPSGEYQANYPLLLDARAVRLELGELLLLRKIPLEEPQRLVFGARLQSVRLEQPGPTWVVRFQPESGLLLTDPQAAARCCPDSAAQVEKQGRLAAELP